jgi:hypothetical protein
MVFFPSTAGDEESAHPARSPPWKVKIALVVAKLLGAPRLMGWKLLAARVMPPVSRL